MLKWILIYLTAIFLAMTFASCNSAQPPAGTDQNGNTGEPVIEKGQPFEEIYADYISDDEEKAKAAKTELNRRLGEFHPELLKIATEQDPVRSPGAIELIGKYDNDEARDVILPGLDSEHREIVVASIIAIGYQEDERAFEQLMELSYSDDVGIRGNCITVLANFPDREGVKDRIRELAGDEDKRVRLAAYSAMGKISDPEDDRFLYDAMIREAAMIEPDNKEGEMLLFIVSNALRNVLDTDDCEWFVEGLGDEYPDSLRYTIFDAAAEQHCGNAVDPLIEICRDTDDSDMTRFRAGFTLAYIGDLDGYKTAEHIYHQVEYGNININQMNFPSFPTTMSQYRELLNDMEMASKLEE